MSEPRGSAGGSTTDIGPVLPHPTTPTGETPVDVGTPPPTVPREETGTPPADASPPATGPGDEPDVIEQVPAEATLDASVHAHVLDDPLPPVDDEADPPLFAATRAPRDGAGQPETAPSEVQDEAKADDPPDETAAHPAARHTLDDLRVPLRDRHWFRLAAGTAVGLALLGSVGIAGYLYASATGWRAHADDYLATSRDLAEDLSASRGDLAGAQAELQAVRDQLATAHARITELASEKAQISDEWELTQQVVDYQERVSKAAGEVALALDQCVQGQQELIGYLTRAAEERAANPTGGPTNSPPPYDPNQLALFEADVEAFCQAASEANISLQQELAR